MGNKKEEFYECQPYIGFDEKKGILANKIGDISIIFHLKNLPIYGEKDYEFYDKFNKGFGKLLEGLGEKTIVQKIDFVWKGKRDKTAEKPLENRDWLDIEAEKIREQQQTINSESYIVITLTAKIKELKLIKYIWQQKKNEIISNDNTSPERIESLFSESEKICNLLLSFGIETEKVSNQEKIDEILIKKYFQLNFGQQGQHIDISDYTNCDSYLKIGNKYLQRLSFAKHGIPNINNYDTLKEYRDIPASFLSRVLVDGDSCDRIINTVIKVSNKKEIIKEIDDRRKYIPFFSKIGDNQQIINTLQEVKEEIETGNIKFHKGYFGVTFISEDINEINKSIKKTAGWIRDKGGLAMIDTFNNIRSFLTYGFGNGGIIPQEETAIVQNGSKNGIATYIILEQARQQTPKKDGILLYNRHTKNVSILDFEGSNTANKNMVVIGGSGAGKSVLLGYFTDEFFKNPHNQVVLVDIGYSSKNLCKHYRGAYIEPSNDNPIAYNPFNLIKEKKEEKGYYIEKDDLEFIVLFLFTCWKGQDNEAELKGTIKSTLQRLIGEYITFCNKNQTSREDINFNNFYFHSITFLKKDIDYKNIDSKTFDKKSFTIIFKDYLSEDKDKDIEAGIHANVLSGSYQQTENIEKNRLVTFEYQQITESPQLFKITFFLTIRIVMNRLINQERKGRLFLVIDEAWLIIANKQGVGFIEYCFRTFRKHGGSIAIATQNFSDISENKAIEPIIKSCSFIVIKKQPESEKENFKKYFDLTEYETNLFFSMKDKHREVAILQDQEMKIYYIDIPDPLLNLLKTEKEHRKQFEEKMKKYKGNTTQVLKEMKEETMKL